MIFARDARIAVVTLAAEDRWDAAFIDAARLVTLLHDAASNPPSVLAWAVTEIELARAVAVTEVLAAAAPNGIGGAPLAARSRMVDVLEPIQEDVDRRWVRALHAERRALHRLLVQAPWTDLWLVNRRDTGRRVEAYFEGVEHALRGHRDAPHPPRVGAFGSLSNPGGTWFLDALGPPTVETVERYRELGRATARDAGRVSNAIEGRVILGG